ncbi:hypothetical protein BYT27DRAFT_7227042 [Phlegmacium glaucopus]|nr:hypothetical protein BYT27DRAFT_7227042 [Phlegmacium glaucopus]
MDQNTYKVKRFERPTTLRLIQIDTNDQVAEEAVFTIQGVLSAKHLPPVTENIRTPSQACYLRQGVALVGYGTATFEKAINSAQEIYGMFERNVEDASLESWVLPKSTVQGRALEASNRYLTSKRDAPDMQPAPISPLVDPRGILEKLTKEGFLHGEENEVHYYQVHKNDAGGKTSVETVNPQIFRIGDIVEAQVSFIVVPLKDNKHKMIVVLRSIALLDTRFSKVRTIIR